MRAILTLWQRELVRFYRDRSRIVGALTPPIVFWFVIGSGAGASFQLGSMSFLQFFFSGTLVLIVLFTSIFSTISIIEDRREGFLQSVLVAPIPRLSIVLGKVLGASTVGFAQGMTFLAFAPLVGLHAGGIPTAALALLLCSVGLTGLGFCIAWKLDSTQGFHAVMNLFLIPMWMLSGALFPLSTAPVWLRAMIRVNPVTYGVAALQQALTPGQPAAASLPVCMAVLAVFAVAMTLISAAVASRRDSR
jgi:ABC-2 type transport system permease protein